jgi:hypothetical protein
MRSRCASKTATLAEFLIESILSEWGIKDATALKAGGEISRLVSHGSSFACEYALPATKTVIRFFKCKAV